MTFQPLHRDKRHKFKNGQWTWKPYDDVDAKLKFISHSNMSGLADKRRKVTEHCPHNFGDLEFSKFIDEAEEKIFLKIFARPKNSHLNDDEVITIQDIKNLSLFLAAEGSLTKDFIEFLHMSIFDEFLHATIFYIDHFLLTLEFLLIRRDEIKFERKIRDLLSMDVERFLSKQLSNRRLLMAREYSKVLLHRGRKLQNAAEKDLKFFEALIDFSIQCIFIAMHRRAFNAICECLDFTFPHQISLNWLLLGFFQLAN